MIAQQTVARYYEAWQTKQGDFSEVAALVSAVRSEEDL